MEVVKAIDAVRRGSVPLPRTGVLVQSTSVCVLLRHPQRRPTAHVGTRLNLGFQLGSADAPRTHVDKLVSWPRLRSQPVVALWHRGHARVVVPLARKGRGAVRLATGRCLEVPRLLGIADAIRSVPIGSFVSTVRQAVLRVVALPHLCGVANGRADTKRSFRSATLPIGHVRVETVHEFRS